MLKSKKNKGITLIALVVTIVILLILAGVSIIALTGDNGILNQAAKAKEKSEQANKNEISSLSNIENMINNYINGLEELNDDRLGNEKIIITKAEQIYALGRISMNDNVRNSYIPNYTIDGSFELDLNLFDYPTQVVTNEEKIEYLMTTSYRLENNIEIKLQRNGISSYFGIGGTERPFKGFFNGNGKKVILSETSLNPSSVGPGDIGGIFGNIDGGTLANLDIELGGNITFKQELVLTSFGIAIGTMNNTKLYNINTYINGNQLQFLFDDAQYRAETNVGGIVARANGKSQIQNCSLNLKNNARMFITDNNDADTYNFYMGGIAAFTSGEETARTIISNCNINLDNSNMYMIIPNSGLCGGVVGRAKKTTILDTKVNLKDSTIGILAIHASETFSKYYSIATGGIIGYAEPGSDNTENTIGNEGITIDNSSFNSINTTQKDILFAKETSGSAPNVGGIVGLAFNNCSIKNTNVNITNGTMIAEKTMEDEHVIMNSTCGGIIGRLEHTGLIENCIVNGNSLNIIAKATNKEIYSGGIVGIDMGPEQKNQISLQNNKFIGNNTSSIIVELVRGSKENAKIYVGGIAGQSAYIMKGCTVSGVSIYHKGTDSNVSMSAIGKLVGRFDCLNAGMWMNSNHFVPETTRGVIGCTTKDTNIIVEDNDSGIVSTGEECGKVY